MTVSSTNTKQSYSGDGSTTVFTYNFKINSQAELTVISRSSLGTETVKTLNSDYTIIDNGASGGSVTFSTAPGSTETIVLIRDTALTQTTDYIANDPFPAETHEAALDKLTLQMQEVQEEVDRSLKLSRTNTMTSTEFTNDATDRALKVFAFDGAGDLSVAQELGSFKGDWATATVYKQRDIVKDTSTNNVFFVNTSHTSSGSQPLTTNANSAKYSLIVDAASATTSASNAATSETNAANSATAASTSETNAATSATAASTSATAAATSETNAGTSETNAASSATAAATSATNAATSETNAASSASTASTQASTATTQAGTATTQATNASNSASAASTSETNAASSATAAANSASAASTSETNAATSATNSASSATAASTSATNAANAQAAAEAALDTFDDKFLGNKTSDPSVDNDGNALTDGALYFDTTNNVMKVYDLGTTAWLQLTPSTSDQANINAAVSNATNINTVAGISSEVTSVAGNSTNINAVNSNSSNINTVAGDTTAINNVSGAISDIQTANSNSSNINTVAGAITNVNAVGGDIANVNTVASNVSGVNSFAERYRVDSSDPTTSLDAGDLAFNTTASALKYYDGSAWNAIVAGSLTDIVQDATPQLGGGLDLNSNDITGTGNINITGGVTMSGDLTVNGTTTTINSTTLTVDDKNIVLASGAADSAAADGAGITIDGASATLLYNDSGTKWSVNKDFDVTGTCTATTFSGSGASLTSLPSAQLTGALPAIDGSALTGVSSFGGATGADLNDDVKLRFGTGNDLEIFHDGNNGIIKQDALTGLEIMADNFRVQNSAGTETLIAADGDGAVSLYHDDTQVVTTSANGLEIPADNLELRIGAGADIKLYHDGNDSYMKNETGGLFILGNNAVQIKDDSNTKTMAKFVEDGACEFYHNNTHMASTVTEGFRVEADKRLEIGNGTNWSGEQAGKIENHSDSMYIQYTTSFITRNPSGTNTLTVDSSGNGTFNGNVTAYSDVRIKDDIKTIDNALDKVSKLRGVEYTRKETEAREIGVIAQEVKEIVPELVTIENLKSDINPDALEDMHTMKYGNTVGLLIEAIKELKAEIEELKGNK